MKNILIIALLIFMGKEANAQQILKAYNESDVAIVHSLRPFCQKGKDIFICCKENTQLQLMIIGAGFSTRAEWYCLPIVQLDGNSQVQVEKAFITKEVNEFEKLIGKNKNGK